MKRIEIESLSQLDDVAREILDSLDGRSVVLFRGGMGAGKTTLAEAMAYLSGITNRLGKVTDGNTVSDYDKEEIKRKVEEAARILDITHLLDRKPKALSGGQRQRVAMGRAIVRNPKVFLMDEPLSNLDAKLRVQMRTEISKLHEKLGTTIIYVTHDQTEAMTMADRIVVMSKGNIEKIGTPREIFSQVEWVKSLALDVPQTSDLMHHLNAYGYSLPTDTITIDECAAQLYKFLEE